MAWAVTACHDELILLFGIMATLEVSKEHHLVKRRDFMGTHRDEFDEVEEPIKEPEAIEEEPEEELERLEQARLRAKEASELP